MACFGAADAATPIIKLAVDTMASSEPSTAARNHPARPVRCASPCVRRALFPRFVSIRASLRTARPASLLPGARAATAGVCKACALAFDARRAQNALMSETLWRPLFRLGAVAGALASVGTVADLTLGLAQGTDLTRLPQTAGERFAQLAAHPWVGLYDLDLLNVIISLVSLPMVVAVGALLMVREARPLAGLALVLSLIATAVFVSSNATLPMLSLSAQYEHAGSEAQRAALLGAGEALLARGAHGAPGAFPGFVLSTLASLTLALSMVGTRAFGRLTGLLGAVAFPLLLLYLVAVTFVPALQTVAVLLAAPGGLLAIAWQVRVVLGLARASRS